MAILTLNNIHKDLANAEKFNLKVDLIGIAHIFSELRYPLLMCELRIPAGPNSLFYDTKFLVAQLLSADLSSISELIN